MSIVSRSLPMVVMVLALVNLALVGERPAAADTATGRGVERLFAELRSLVGRHYPGAVVVGGGDALRFEFNVRSFMIHEPTRRGDAWQDAHEETGPQPGGIHGTIELRPGRYAGAAIVPQDFDLRYFTVRLSAAYSSALDRHLYIRLKYPRNVPPEFLSDFARLTSDFDAYVTRHGK